jgi:SAM-dependent methyltransferase
MKFPSADDIEKVIYEDSSLVLPEKLRAGIAACLSSSPDQIETAKAKISAEYVRDYSQPPKIEYEDVSIIDAYTIDYLPRNFFVSKLAIRDLALSAAAVNFGKVIRVLDVGSGTGAVTLGLFDLFSKPPLNNYNIHLLALDSSALALARQDELRQKGFTYKGDSFKYKTIDLKDNAAVGKELSKHEEWDIIVSANFLNELDPQNQLKLVKVLSQHLAAEGSLVIAEPAQDRGKMILKNISAAAVNMGLSIFYPCSSTVPCPKYKCWKWREYPRRYVNPIQKDGTWISFSTKPLLISCLILNKSGVTIFDSLKKKHKGLKWDIIAPYGTSYETCDRSFTAEEGKYSRGSLIGWREVDDNIFVEVYKKL